MVIRAFEKGDRAACLSLLEANTPRFFAAEEARDYQHYLDHEIELYFVIEHASRIVGAGGINCFPALSFARLSWDLIHPDMQGQGLGRKLVAHRLEVIQWLNQQVLGAYTLVQVRTTQLVAPFYERQGFELVKTGKDFWAPGFDLYQFHLLLY